MAIWIPGPSFSRSIARASRDRPFVIARALLSKPSARELIEALGASVPGDFRLLGAIDDLTPKALRTPTIIKPVQGSNNRGVLPLVPMRPDLWHDPVHREDLRFEQIRARLARALVRHDLPDAWIGEELLRAPDGGPIDDVKFMTFRGRVAACLVRRNSPKVFRWFDDTWNPLDSGIRLHPVDPTIEPPEDRGRLQELASRISRALPIPFVRVDLYSTPAGPVVGELTPFPGWAHDFSPAMDARFGALYEEAETELIAAGMNWGALTENEALRTILAGLVAGSRT